MTPCQNVSLKKTKGFTNKPIQHFPSSHMLVYIVIFFIFRNGSAKNGWDTKWVSLKDGILAILESAEKNNNPGMDLK